ncbi:MAG TPA: helix-turn-helix domain-containing protein [Gaiellaceae bacterium]|nr:helix-turn-helix domain-containing protein [Gaiellaceae bacterium]
MSSIAVDAGTTGRSCRRTASFEISEVTFDADRRLGWHSHPRSCIAVVVDGVVRKRFSRLEADADAGTVVAMPAGELHEDAFGREGARIVVVESDAAVGRVSCAKDWEAAVLAARIAREFTVDDAFTPLALEGLALELTATVGRGPVRPRPERWLQEAYDLLHERFRSAPTAAEIASRVGVHPSHLARRFRAHYRESLGGCVRRLRLEWAAGELLRSDVPLACLAHEAGFVDQSHFTRAFKERFGVTPARYRSAHR